MMGDGFRARLRAGELLVGTMVTLGYPEIGEILARAGFDWLFLDGEHSPMMPPDLQRVMQGAGRAMPCLVRLASGDPVSIKKALDSGAVGLVCPHVDSAAKAADIARWSRFGQYSVYAQPSILAAYIAESAFCTSASALAPWYG